MLVRPRLVVAGTTPTVSAPSGFYTHGTQVGVPTGTSLTATSGLPSADATGQSLTLTNPISGASTIRSCSVWYRRSWTTTLSFTPNPVGATYLFDECRFENNLDNFCVDVIDTNGTFDIMQPIAVFRRCSFNGNDTTSRCLNGGFLWLIDCHLERTEDCFGGVYYSVVMGTNINPSSDAGVDPHQDGLQGAGIGEAIIYRSAVSAGTDPIANSAIRFGTDFSAITNVWVYYNWLDKGGYTTQFRGDVGSRGITNVRFKGNRWSGNSPNGNAGFGPTDFLDTVVAEWTDNKFAGDNVNVPNPAP